MHCPWVVVGLAAVGVHIDGYHVISSIFCWYGIVTLLIAIVASALPYFLERLDLIFLFVIVVILPCTYLIVYFSYLLSNFW